MKSLLHIVLIALNSLQLGLLILHSMYFTDRHVWDMELVRKQYEENIRYIYQRGCLEGTGWSQSDTETVGFNRNSPINYCNASRDESEWIFESAKRDLGKIKPVRGGY